MADDAIATGWSADGPRTIAAQKTGRLTCDRGANFGDEFVMMVAPRRVSFGADATIGRS